MECKEHSGKETEEPVEYSSVKMEFGEIEGAKFAIAVPAVVSDKSSLLIHAHGCRPEGIKLVADLDPKDGLYSALLKDGWLIALTSYRKEGLVVKDAIQDLHNLRDYIVHEYGPLKSVILEGESMGGAIVTFISEQANKEDKKTLYDGILAIGAALLVEGTDNLDFSHQPKIPILYLTNTDETHIIEDYKEKCSQLKSEIEPALWMVARNGHCNVNSIERLTALKALLEWTNGQKIDLIAENTHNIDIGKSQVFFDDEGGWGKITHTDAWGDVYTNLQPTDLDKLGIHHGDSFKIELGGKRFQSKGREFKAIYGANSFLSANQGQWYVYDHAEGYIAISANGYAHPARVTDQAQVKEGDSVHVLRPIGVGAALTGIPGGVDTLRNMIQKCS